MLGLRFVHSVRAKGGHGAYTQVATAPAQVVNSGAERLAAPGESWEIDAHAVQLHSLGRKDLQCTSSACLAFCLTFESAGDAT